MPGYLRSCSELEIVDRRIFLSLQYGRSGVRRRFIAQRQTGALSFFPYVQDFSFFKTSIVRTMLTLICKYHYPSSVLSVLVPLTVLKIECGRWPHENLATEMSALMLHFCG